MKLFSAILVLILAIAISSVAAYFSVVGLAAIFSATFWSVVVMGVVLEAGKVVSAGWLHSNWKNKHVNAFHKGYMVAAVVALMLITSLGIYGFLAKGHLEQSQPLAPVELKIAQKNERIKQLDALIAAQNTRLSQLDGAVNSMISGDKAAQGLRFRARQSGERKEVQDKIDAANAEKMKISEELVPLKLQVNEVETKLGPVKYVGEALGINDTEGAVRIVIAILMFAFDPLAIILVISGTISLSEALAARGKPTKPDFLSEGVETEEEHRDPVIENWVRWKNSQIKFGPVKAEFKPLNSGSIFPEFNVDVPMPKLPENKPTFNWNDVDFSALHDLWERENHEGRIREAMTIKQGGEAITLEAVPSSEFDPEPVELTVVETVGPPATKSFKQALPNATESHVVETVVEEDEILEDVEDIEPEEGDLYIDTRPDEHNNLLIELEEDNSRRQKEDREAILDILARRPDLVLELVDVFNVENTGNSATSSDDGTWLDDNWSPPR